MKPTEALKQVEHCMSGLCDYCVHNESFMECHDLRDEIIRTLAAELILAESYRQLQSGEFMNKPE